MTQDRHLYAEVYRLQQTLIWWEDTFPNRFTTGKGFLTRNLLEGPAFAEWLDDAIKYSFRLSAGKAFISDFSDYPEQAESVWGFDHFMSPYHCIPFLPQEGDDYKLVFEEKPPIPAELLNLLKEEMRKYIRVVEKLPQLDDLDRLKLQTGTKMLSPSGRKEFNFAYRGSNGLPLSTTNSFHYERCFVYKAPHECRDAFIPDLKTRNSLLLIHKQCKEALCHPCDALPKKDFSFLHEWLTAGRNHYFVMSDQKKCGLTFPLELIKVFIECLKEAYPNEDLSHFDGYTNAYLQVDGYGTRKILNGVGLGMANEIISFIVSCLFSAWNSRRGGDLQALFYNDDQVIRFKYDDSMALNPEPDLEDILEGWNDEMARHRMAIHRKKPFASTAGVFLETYGDFFNKFQTDKVSQFVGCLFHSLCMPTIGCAKEFVAGVWDCIPPALLFYAQDALSRVISCWGYEFHQREISLPFEIGGWTRHFSGKLNLALEVAESLSGWESRFVRLLGVKKRLKPDPRGLKFKNREKFDLITQLGYNDDPTPWNWEFMASSALHPNKVRPRGIDSLKTYGSWENRRREAFQEDPPLFTHGIIKDYFMESGMRGGFAIPPSLLGPCKYVQGPMLLHQMKDIWYKDRVRAWHQLCHDRRLSELNISFPASYTEDQLARLVFDWGDHYDDYDNSINMTGVLLSLLTSFNPTYVRELNERHFGESLRWDLLAPLESQLVQALSGQGDHLTFDIILGTPLRGTRGIWAEPGTHVWRNQSTSIKLMFEEIVGSEVDMDYIGSVSDILEIFKEYTEEANRRLKIPTMAAAESTSREADIAESQVKEFHLILASIAARAELQLDRPDRVLRAAVYGDPDVPDIFDNDDDSDLGLDFG